MERQHLIDLCEAGVVAHDKWSNRDSASAQENIGTAWAYLKAGCAFRVLTEENRRRGTELVTDDRTIWIEISFRGFPWFEGVDDETDPLSLESYHIPTQKRLDEANGEDWY